MQILKAVVLVLAAGIGSHAAITMEPSLKSFEYPAWNQGERVSKGDTMELTFVLKSCPMKRAELEEKFWSVSDPFNKDYKNYLSRDEISNILHPLPEEGKISTAEFVKSFLLEQDGLIYNNDIRITDTRDLITVTVNADIAELFFNAELYHYKPKKEELREIDRIRASTSYSLPDELAPKISLVDKLVRLPNFHNLKKSSPLPPPSFSSSSTDDDSAAFDSCVETKCKGATTPEVLRLRYGFPQLDTYSDGNSMACAEFEGQGIVSTDLSDFSTACNVSHVKVDVTQGAGGSAVAGVEASLDVEYIEAVAAPIPLTVINSLQYSIFDWAEALNNDANPSWVQSVSYGNDECQQTSDEYMYECNTQFMQNGVRGLSVLFASGDQGVWGRTGVTSDKEFHPGFPASSPYITTVGGTQFLETSVIGDETTWADGGGGFSNTFAMPSYQVDAVKGYLESGVELPDSYQYNATGRAYPDIAALAGVANGYCVAAKGSYEKVGGTSAACPVFAGNVAILNDMLLQAGDQPMGFLNQWIYGVAGPAGVFNDVTTGTNNAGTGNGFTATKGWDPATGFGTPNFDAMLNIILPSKKN